MKIKTNIVLDEFNHNDRIYESRAFENSLEEAFKNKVLVYNDSASASKNILEGVIGYAKDYEIIDNNLELDIHFLETSAANQSQELLKLDFSKITSFGYGRIDEVTKEVKDYRLVGFFATSDFK